MDRRQTLTFAWLLATLALLPAAHGSTFGLSPTRLQLSPASPTALLSVSNGGTRPVTLQVRAFAWTQSQADDAYVQSREFVISPPIFTLAPGETQRVRVAQRSPRWSDVERAYRLIVAEVPQAELPTIGEAALRIALRMNIPMFVSSARATATAEPVMSAEGSGARPRLRIDNHGTANLRLAALVVERDGEQLAGRDVLVVLPGASRFIDLPVTALKSDAPLKVRAMGNGGPIDVSVPMRPL